MIFLERQCFTPIGPVKYQVPYFPELVADGKDAQRTLPKDIACHALFYYFILASKAKDTADKCLVEEHDRSPVFNQRIARQIAETVASLSGIQVAEMVKWWPQVINQRRAMGLNENADLPHALRFQFN